MKHRRNSLRKGGWHYGAAGYYFVTICTHGRELLFDSAEFKQIVETVLESLPTFNSATTIELDESIVMPNHLHFILVIVDGFSAEAEAPSKTISGTIGAHVATLKSTATRRINNVRRSKGAKVWQRGYYDRIIRNERELHATREYIRNNPQRWQEDRDNLDALLEEMTYHK